MSTFSNLVLLSGVALIVIGALFTISLSKVRINCLCATTGDCCQDYFKEERVLSASIMGYGVMLVALVWHVGKQETRPVIQ